MHEGNFFLFALVKKKRRRNRTEKREYFPNGIAEMCKSKEVSFIHFYIYKMLAVAAAAAAHAARTQTFGNTLSCAKINECFII